MKQIPYGIDNFERIIRDDYYFIDKTRFIPTVENQASFLLFVRPRRMGKSLFVNMLMSYYDINNKERFDELFGNLWIGLHPTKWANKFLVLKFDFSQVGGDSTTLVSNFENYCRLRLKDYFERYNEIYTQAETEDCMSQAIVKDIINRMIDITRRKNLPTYLFIDEYDNFSNTVLAARGVNAHHEITHGEGFYRDFFKACKGTFDRVFMTGVAPVTYDDLTSGFNIADVVALLPRFDKVIGVTEQELRELIEYYRGQGCYTRDTEDIITEMKPWYDGFCFCDEWYDKEPPIYNTDMVMRYMKSMVLNGEPPKVMLDTNARTDYQKLNFLVMSEDLDNREYRIELVKEICSKGYIYGSIQEQFPASRCGDEANFKSMLYYLGTLTFGGYGRGGTKLVVPNKTMGELYLSYLQKIAEDRGGKQVDEYRELMSAIAGAAIDGDWQPMLKSLGVCYNRYSSIRNSVRGEADIQGFVRGLLCLNDYFEVWPELELGDGYCDILLVPRKRPDCPTRHSYILELKYMKASDRNIEARIAEACEQLEQYISDKHLTDSPLLCGTPLTKLYVIFRGKKLARSGAIQV